MSHDYMEAAIGGLPLMYKHNLWYDLVNYGQYLLHFWLVQEERLRIKVKKPRNCLQNSMLHGSRVSTEKIGSLSKYSRVCSEDFISCTYLATLLFATRVFILLASVQEVLVETSSSRCQTTNHASLKKDSFYVKLRTPCKMR